jgi:hypothetical protein
MLASPSGIADHWRLFNQNDGLVWNDTNGSVFYEDTDGSMWIATSNGASHVRHPDLLFAPQQLNARIETAAATMRSRWRWTSRGRLPWSNRPLEMDLASLHIPEPRRAALSTIG